MAYVVCELAEGLRPSEVTVSIRGIDGNNEFLRVEKDFVAEMQGKHYLPIGIVFRDDKRVLIELPHEADSGTNRLWVETTSIWESGAERERRKAYAI